MELMEVLATQPATVLAVALYFMYMPEPYLIAEL
jgi:hypothetical protein